MQCPWTLLLVSGTAARIRSGARSAWPAMARDCQGAAEVIGVVLTGGRLDHMIGQPLLDVLAEGLPSPRVEIPSPQLSRLHNLHEQLCA